MRELCWNWLGLGTLQRCSPNSRMAGHQRGTGLASVCCYSNNAWAIGRTLTTRQRGAFMGSRPSPTSGRVSRRPIGGEVLRASFGSRRFQSTPLRASGCPFNAADAPLRKPTDCLHRTDKLKAFRRSPAELARARSCTAACPDCRYGRRSFRSSPNMSGHAIRLDLAARFPSCNHPCKPRS